MSETLYHETQRMMQPVVAATVALIMLVIEVIAILSYRGDIDLGRGTDSVGLCVVTAVAVIIVMLALFLRMDVTVSDQGIRIRTVGTRFIPKEDIESVEIRDRIRAVREYGGWGIRLWFRGIGYIAPGNDGGVEIRIAGRRTGILISSRDPGSLLEAVSTLLRRGREDEPQGMEPPLLLRTPRFETEHLAADVLDELPDLPVGPIDRCGPVAHRPVEADLPGIVLGVDPEPVGEFDAEHQEHVGHLGIGDVLPRGAVRSGQRTLTESVGLLHRASLLPVVDHLQQAGPLHLRQETVHGGAGDVRIPVAELLDGDALGPDRVEEDPARARVDENLHEPIVHGTGIIP